MPTQVLGITILMPQNLICTEMELLGIELRLAVHKDGRVV